MGAIPLIHGGRSRAQVAKPRIEFIAVAMINDARKWPSLHSPHKMVQEDDSAFPVHGQ